MMPRILTLTEAQLRAVMSGEDNTLIVAGPGSGKTTVVIERVTFLIRSGVDPLDIVVLTYTIAAAGEIADRLGDVRLGFVGTLHAFCLRFLRDYAPGMKSLTVVSREEADAELKRVADNLGVKCSMDRLRRCVKAGGMSTAEEQFDSKVRLAVASYLRAMAGYDATDFDTLVRTALAWMTKPGAQRWGIAHLIVDELQDASDQDHEVYAAIDAGRRFYVGDPDQSVFAFRGGRRRVMLALTASPEWSVLTLEGNFRSAPEICVAAQRLIQNDPERVQKTTTSFMDSGGRVGTKEHGTDVEEAVAIGQGIQYAVTAAPEPDQRRYEDFAVLCRTNAIAADVGWHLKAEGVPVRTRRRPERTPERQLAVAALGALVSRGEFAVARYWRARMGVAAADERISREYRIGTGFIVLDEDAELKRTPESLGDDLRALDVDQESVAELEALRDGLRTSESDPTLADVALAAEEREELDQGDGVTVTTIHGAKGREWHTVILASFEDEVIPGRHQDEVDEERRVAYVGMTRAKRGLWLSYARARRRWWGDNRLAPSTPSRFIAEAGL